MPQEDEEMPDLDVLDGGDVADDLPEAQQQQRRLEGNRNNNNNNASMVSFSGMILYNIGCNFKHNTYAIHTQYIYTLIYIPLFSHLII